MWYNNAYRTLTTGYFMGKASPLLTAGFIAIAAILVAGLLAALHVTARRFPDVRRRAAVIAAAATIWVVFTGLAAAKGQLRFDTVPPTMFIIIILTIIGAISFARSTVAARLADTLPLWLLIAWQGFRLPLELLMHRAYAEGIMPEQMSYSGLNFDIVTGASALVVAWLLRSGRGGRAMALAWNAVGAGLLLNIIAIAVLSTPTPLRMFHNEPANVWITRFPFVWLPVLMVSTAIAGHLIIFRKLRTQTG
jgi:hypothetical protein